MMNEKPSKETQEQALKVAKGTQKKGQSKEQTKLIAQGIEKGIVEYKKQQSKKSRERDQQRKLQSKAQRSTSQDEDIKTTVTHESKNMCKLPWCLLCISWLGFATYLYYL